MALSLGWSERMPTVPSENPDREPRRRGPSVRARFVRRAETLKTDAAFRRNICRLRRAWNRVYPEYALGNQGWMPDPVPNYRLICLPPALGREYDALVKAGDDIRENWKVFVRWRC